MGEKKIIKTTCKSCHGGCGVLVEVQDGAITHIEGNPDSTTRGTMCSKGLSALQHVNHPDRVLYPMKRTTPKGELANWKRITWEEALDTIESKMKESIAKYGPTSIAVSQGTGRGYNEYTHRFASIFKIFGPDLVIRIMLNPDSRFPQRILADSQHFIICQ